MAPGAALEVDLGPALEFLLRHDRIALLAARNLDLDFGERRHRRLIGGGRSVRVILGLLLREDGRGKKTQRQRGAAQKDSAG